MRASDPKAEEFSPGLIVVRRELVEELLDAVLLPHRVDVRHFVLGQRREVEVDLQKSDGGDENDDGQLVIRRLNRNVTR